MCPEVKNHSLVKSCVLCSSTIFNRGSTFPAFFTCVILLSFSMQTRWKYFEFVKFKEHFFDEELAGLRLRQNERWLRLSPQKDKSLTESRIVRRKEIMGQAIRRMMLIDHSIIIQCKLRSLSTSGRNMYVCVHNPQSLKFGYESEFRSYRQLVLSSYLDIRIRILWHFH